MNHAYNPGMKTLQIKQKFPQTYPNYIYKIWEKLADQLNSKLKELSSVNSKDNLT